jgi:hypothetical protein
MEAARTYIHQFDTKNNITRTVMCNKVESELYRMRASGEKKQKTGWLENQSKYVYTIFASHSMQVLGQCLEIGHCFLPHSFQSPPTTVSSYQC